MSVLALIPARAGSKGIPGKNWRVLGVRTLIEHAVNCAHKAQVDHAALSTDLEMSAPGGDYGHWFIPVPRPAALAQDDTPMIDVVKHALNEIPGEPDQIIVLLQPTQPFRKPEHIRQAIALLQESGADSVVSVVELPKTHNAEAQLGIYGRTGPRGEYLDGYCHHSEFPEFKNRQQRGPAYIRDGTVYAFKRANIETCGHIYGYRHIGGYRCRPLVIAPEDTCELDTEADWAEVERRWKERA